MTNIVKRFSQDIAQLFSTHRNTVSSLAVMATLLTSITGMPHALQAQTGALTLGDRIWLDANVNGLIDNNEGGVANLTVRLFKVNSQPGVYQEIPLATTTTDAAGVYRFAQLEAGTYFVTVEKWQTVGLSISPLLGGVDDDIDNNNDGSDPRGPFVPQHFRSQQINLALGSEPVTDGDGDANTNLTLDIGLFPESLITPTPMPTATPTPLPTPTYSAIVTATPASVATSTPLPMATFTPEPLSTATAQPTQLPTATKTAVPTATPRASSTARPTPTPRPTATPTLAVAMSLGNRVFIDTNNNGVQEGIELGIAGVTLQLLRASDSAVVQTMVSTSGGYYRFASVAPGSYRIVVTVENFSGSGVLVGKHVGPVPNPAPDNDIDKDNNGRAQPDGSVSSDVIVLTVNGEPTNDGDSNPNTNLAVDFGFVS